MKNFIMERMLQDVEVHQEKYNLRNLSSKNLGSCLYFSPRDFKDYAENNKAFVVGAVKINKRNKKSHDENAKGTCFVYDKNDEKVSFDILPANQSGYKIIGYGYVGNNDYVELIEMSLIPLLIPLIIAILIGVVLCSCPKDGSLNWANDNNITNQSSTTQVEEKPLCYFVPFSETTTLNKDSKYINLMNVPENKGNYYISYEIYIDGKPIKNENGEIYQTGYIEPSKQVSYDLWSVLDKGEYDLTLIATEYDFELLNKAQESTFQKQKMLDEATMPNPTKLTTKLIIEK